MVNTLRWSVGEINHLWHVFSQFLLVLVHFQQSASPGLTVQKCKRIFCVILVKPVYVFSPTRDSLWTMLPCRVILGYKVFSMPTKISICILCSFVVKLCHTITGALSSYLANWLWNCFCTSCIFHWLLCEYKWQIICN